MKHNAYLAKRAATITAERADAAQQALFLAVIALNETEGINLGRERINRFADTLMRVTDEFEADKKTDPKYAVAKLREKIGKIMGG